MQLEEVQQELENEKGSRETRLKQLGDSITDLWAKLETPQEEQDEFFENHHGIGNSVLEAVRLPDCVFPIHNCYSKCR